MSSPQTVDEVIAWLRDRGEPVMALIVQTLQENYREARAINESNVAACNALREKYEPAFRYPTHRAPAESNG